MSSGAGRVVAFVMTTGYSFHPDGAWVGQQTRKKDDYVEFCRSRFEPVEE
jgi:hypothetical protein